MGKNIFFGDTTIITDKLIVNEGENSVEIDKIKGTRYNGDSTVWKDMIMDLFGRRLYNNIGTVDYDYNENSIIFQPNGDITDVNDRIGGNQEINHEMEVGENIEFRPHLHYWQQIASGVANANVFTIRYRLQRNGYAKETTWNEISATSGVDDVFDLSEQSDGTYNQILKFTTITFDCGVSDTIQIQMTRTDAIDENISVTFFDLHGKVDSDGSETEYGKS